MWAILVATLPTQPNAVRLRVWRALKGLGCAALRDGAYLLPAAQTALFEPLAAEVREHGGTALVLRLSPQDDAQRDELLALFDRSEAYAQWRDGGHALQAELPALAEAEARRRLRTRARPWVDRLASAWLIRRFIDTQARFVWLADPAQAPRAALGFDYDSARFTHVGARVTFEVLLASFGLDGEARLQRLAASVRYLDVGGIPVAEAAGLESVLAGLRELHADDDALLAAASAVFDALHAAPDAAPQTIKGALK